MNTRRITEISCVVTVVVLTVYDVFVYTNAVEGDTISEVINGLAIDWPVLAWAWGVLGGHWFWMGKSDPFFGREWLRFTILSIIAGVFVVIGSIRLTDYDMLFALLAGIITGHFIWPFVPSPVDDKNQQPVQKS